MSRPSFAVGILRGLFWPRTRRGKIRLLVELAVVLAVLPLGCGQGNRLFYWPNDLVYGGPDREGVAYEDVHFQSADGTKLHGWFVPATTEAKRGTVIYFHGNAQNITAHWAFVSWLPAAGYDLFLFDYRGFGQSEGTPTRQGTFEDGVAALEYVRSRDDVQSDRLVAFGQSLGGALLLAALGETDPHQVRGVAVESTFYSYQGVAQAHVAANPVTWIFAWPLAHWLVTDDHSPSRSLDRLAGVPLMVIHGDADSIVAFSQGRKLYEHAPEPKQWIAVPGGEHCEAVAGYRFGNRYRRQVLAFFERCIQQE